MGKNSLAICLVEKVFRHLYVAFGNGVIGWSVCVIVLRSSINMCAKMDVMHERHFETLQTISR